MTLELARRLLASGAVARADLDRAVVEHASGGRPLVRALVESGALSAARLEAELASEPIEVIDDPLPDLALLARLPARLCARLLAVPLDVDPATGEARIAVVDPFDPHPAREIAFHLGQPVRAVRAPYERVEAALVRLRTSPAQVAPAEPAPERETPAGSRFPFTEPRTRGFSDVPPPDTRRHGSFPK